MQRYKLYGAACLVIVTILMLIVTGCFGGSGPNSDATTEKSVTPVKPSPKIESVIATTSGTEDAYYAILDIKVKNEGAEGTLVVVASVTQNNKTTRNEMDVYLKEGRTHELKMTFPLDWKGGDWTPKVEAQVP